MQWQELQPNKDHKQLQCSNTLITKTLIFDDKNEKVELFEDLFDKMLKMQPEMTEAMKINHPHALLRKEALQTFRNISASSKEILEDVLIVFQQNMLNQNHKPQLNTNGTNSHSIPIQNHCPTS